MKVAKGGAEAEAEMDPTQYFENRTKMLAKYAESSGGRDAVYPHKFAVGRLSQYILSLFEC